MTLKAMYFNKDNECVLNCIVKDVDFALWQAEQLNLIQDRINKINIYDVCKPMFEKEISTLICSYIKGKYNKFIKFYDEENTKVTGCVL
jgi:hypothetical protein